MREQIVPMPDTKPSREEYLAQLAELRPELHRYCSRLTGSVFDGEDIVQNTFVRAWKAVEGAEEIRQFRPWLFRVAHNRALDHLRGQARRTTESLEAAAPLFDDSILDPSEALARQDALTTAITRFVLLPVMPRSVVILKDVLGHSLMEIADLLDLSVAAVKAALHRGRVQLRVFNMSTPPAEPLTKPPSADIVRYVALFNARAWDPLRDLLASEVHLDQVSHPERRGRKQVGDFFTLYGKVSDWHLVVGSVEEREVAAVFTHPEDRKPSYFMELSWHDAKITKIRDFRYARYVAEQAVINV